MILKFVSSWNTTADVSILDECEKHAKSKSIESKSKGGDVANSESNLMNESIVSKYFEVSTQNENEVGIIQSEFNYF